MSQKQPNSPPTGKRPPPQPALIVVTVAPGARPKDRYSLQYMLWRRLQVRQAMNMRSGMD